MLILSLSANLCWSHFLLQNVLLSHIVCNWSDRNRGVFANAPQTAGKICKKILFHKNKVLFHKNKVLFHKNKVLFRKNWVLFNKNKILFYKNKIWLHLLHMSKP